MEDNNVNNIIQNNEDKISTQSTISSAEGKLDFSQSTDENHGSGGGSSSSSSSSGTNSSGTNSSGTSSTDTTQASSDNLTPILLILGDGTDPEPDVDEEPVLLEEDDNVKYKVDHNDNDHYGTSENCINFRNEDEAMADFDNQGETSCSKNILIGLEDETGKLIPIDSNSITMEFTNGGETWCNIKLYKASDTKTEIFNEFNEYKDIVDLDKLWVPLVTVSENTGSERDTIVTFNINNSNILLQRKISAYIAQMAGLETPVPTIKKYSIYMIFEQSLDYNSIQTIFDNYKIGYVGVLTGKQSDFTDNKITGVSSTNSDYQYLYKHSLLDFAGDNFDFTANDGYVSGLMYANHISYDIDLCDKSDMKNYYDSLYNFIQSINESDRKTVYSDFSTSSLPSEYQKDIKELISNNYQNYFIAQYTDPDADIYGGEKIEFMPNWFLYCTSDKQPSQTYCPIPIINQAMGSGYTNTFYGLTSNTIYNINGLNLNKTSLIEHCIIYNETDNKIAYDYNWTNWDDNLTPCILISKAHNTFSLYPNTSATLYNDSTSGRNEYIYSISSDTSDAILYFGLKDNNNNFEGKMGTDLSKYTSKFWFSASDMSMSLMYNNIESKEGTSAIFMVNYTNLNTTRTITVKYNNKFFFTLYQKNRS